MDKSDKGTKKVPVKDRFAFNHNHPYSASKKWFTTKPLSIIKKTMLREKPSFVVRSEDFEPAYMRLFRMGELYRRSRMAIKFLENCKVCPRNCEINRLENEIALCKTGRYAIVSRARSHRIPMLTSCPNTVQQER